MTDTTEPEQEAPVNALIQDVTREDLDSDIEWWFVQYLIELYNEGVVLDAEYNTIPMPLSDPVKHRYIEIMKSKQKAGGTRQMLNANSYKPDFNITFNPQWKDLIYSRFLDGFQFTKQKIPFISYSPSKDACIIELKGDWTKPSELAQTNLKRAWTFDKYQYHIQLIRAPKIFEETFYPQAFLDHPDHIYKVNNAKKKRKKGDSKYPKARTMKQYLDSLEQFRSKPMKSA